MVIRSCEVVFVLGEVVDRSQGRVQNPDPGSLGWRLASEESDDPLVSGAWTERVMPRRGCLK
jgi:hypothetical protein